MTHTTSPWKIARRGLEVELHNEVDTVAYLRTTSLDEDNANLRLIAAAPEMLDALRACEAALYALGDDHRIDSAWSKARAAIGKAEGTT